MMLAHTRKCSLARGAPARAAKPTSRTVVCLAAKQPNSNTTTVLSAAVAACIVATAPFNSAQAAPSASRDPPAAERSSFGAERTAKLIEQGGTPEAVRPENTTNVPFQAPGINAPPRGPGQLKGTSPKKVFGNIKKTIKEQSKDPDSAPFGISKGPLVKSAKKMRSQPGDLGNWNRDAVQRFKQMSADTPAAKAAEADPDRAAKRGIINGSFTTWFGGRNQ